MSALEGVVPAPRTRGSARMRSRLARWDVKYSPYLFIAPFFLLFLVVGMFPLLYTAYITFFDWSLLGGQGDFVGLANYTDILGRAEFWRALTNTVSIFVLSTIPQLILSFGLAALLARNLRGATVWRMGILLPYVIAPVAVSLVFSDLFADRYGLVNTALSTIGLSPVGWHVDPLSSHVALASMVAFRWTGYNALIILAAMQAIDSDVYEAALLDGAGRVRTFFSITLPLLRPTVAFIGLTSIVGGLQIFDEPRAFDSWGLGGSNGQWQTLTLYLWQLGWNQTNLGGAATVAWLLFLVIVIVGVGAWAIARVAGTTRERRSLRASAGGRS